MRRIKYKDEEVLIHTRSGRRITDSLAEQGIKVDCQCKNGNYENCKVKYPLDTLFLLTRHTPLEKQVFTPDDLEQGWRLICEPLWR